MTYSYDYYLLLQSIFYYSPFSVNLQGFQWKLMLLSFWHIRVHVRIKKNMILLFCILLGDSRTSETMVLQIHDHFFDSRNNDILDVHNSRDTATPVLCQPIMFMCQPGWHTILINHTMRIYKSHQTVWSIVKLTFFPWSYIL